MHRLAVRRLSVNAFPKRPGANFIPLTPLSFIDRARHVSRVLHVFGLVPCGFVSSLAASCRRRWRGFTRGSARHVVAASLREVHRNPTG